MKSGITGFGVYLPQFRITRSAIAKAWGRCGAAIERKTVLGFDEDTLTMATDAGRTALERAGSSQGNTALSFASTTPVYGERPSAGSLGMMLSLPDNLFATEHLSSTRAGTEAMVALGALLQSDIAENGLLVASDAPQAAPENPLDHGFGAAAAAFAFGSGEAVATVGERYSMVADYPGQRFRVQGQREVEDIGVPPYSGQALAQVLGGAIKGLLKTTGKEGKDFRFVVAVQPDPKSTGRLLGRLGFTAEQQAVNAWQGKVGDVGAAAPLLGLAEALSQCDAGDSILVVGYGPGAGADAVIVEAGPAVEKARTWGLGDSLEQGEVIDYTVYAKIRNRPL